MAKIRKKNIATDDDLIPLLNQQHPFYVLEGIFLCSHIGKYFRCALHNSLDISVGRCSRTLFKSFDKISVILRCQEYHKNLYNIWQK